MARLIERHRPKVWCKHDIQYKRRIIGYIQLVSYHTKNAPPHLEYHLEEDFRGQGIMSKEFPKYLKKFANHHPALIAVTETTNEISQHLLKKNGFFETVAFEGRNCYILIQNIDRVSLISVLEQAHQTYLHNEYMRKLYG
jgi:RimJ/RimL family protein N-acetyltransferase